MKPPLPPPHPLPALVSGLTAILCLVLFIFMLGGPTYFVSILSGAVWHIATIALIAAAARLAFRSRRMLSAVVCGAIVAMVGYITVFAFALSRK